METMFLESDLKRETKHFIQEVPTYYIDGQIARYEKQGQFEIAKGMEVFKDRTSYRYTQMLEGFQEEQKGSILSSIQALKTVGGEDGKIMSFIMINLFLKGRVSKNITRTL